MRRPLTKAALGSILLAGALLAVAVFGEAQQPKKFELIVNLKAAKPLDLTVPPNVLASADRVIK